MKLDRRQWIKGAALAGVGLTSHYLTTKKAGAAAPAARKGMALTIGLNRVDPQHYSGWSGPLKACEFDAEDMCEIARGEGYECTTLLTRKATRDAAIGEITRAAGALNPGDAFMMSYSGHGGQIPDRNGDEWDNQDETWCLYDGQMIDDELAYLWTKFKQGVRILLFSDSCHSGTMAKFAAYGRFTEAAPDPSWNPADQRAGYNALIGSLVTPLAQPAPSPVRAMPDDVAAVTYRENRVEYDEIASKVLSEKDSRGKIKATVLLISGCQDNQLSSDGTFNGLFTGKLKQAWGAGRFQGTHRDFHGRILNQMPSYQSPNYYVIGQANPDFEDQRPFTV